MNKNEAKIFITFFIISALFSYWTSWNEETNFFLVKAIVDDRSFYLDPYQNVTGDRVYVGKHYLAPFSHWMFAIICTPIYFLFSVFVKETNVLKYFLTILSSSLFFSLSILLMYKFLRRFLKNENQRIFLAFSYGFSTLIFQQARLFTVHSMSTFFALLALYHFHYSYKNKNFKFTILLGILIGICLSLILSLDVFIGVVWNLFLLKGLLPILSIFLTLFVIIKKDEKIVFISLIGLLTYTSVAIGYLMTEEFKLFVHSIGDIPWLPKDFERRVVFPLANFLQLTIFPSKGLFFYYPVLIFAIIGLFVRKNEISSNIFIFLFILSTLILFSFVPLWWYGWVSYGPSRVLTILMPFFVIGLIGFIERFGLKVIIPFVLISVFNNFLLLQYGEDKISTLPWEEYKYKMENFQILSNPLFEHYLPLTLINGPRSILLESLLIDKKINIDLKHPYNSITPEFVPPGSPIIKKFEVYLFSLPKIGIVVLSLPWLSLFIVAGLLILIWKNEILRKIKIKGWILFLILILIFFAFFIRVRDFVYGDNWCAPQWNEDEKKLTEERWIGQNATLILFSRKEMNKILRFEIESFEKNQTLEIYLNKEKIGSYTINQKKEIFQPILLKEGKNIILLHTQEGFIEPWYINVNCDLPQISFKISNISIS
jgi:4-amino-4-deoxy-L-arabinose transferase-like glycosyltransferase